MTTTSVVKEVSITKEKTKELKVQQYGVKTVDLVSDFGDDSSPLKDMIALYSDTSETGESVIIGYINKNQIAKPGEKRIFSLKEDGSVATHVYLKEDGSVEIGVDSADYAVRYSKLKEAFDSLKGTVSELVSRYNSHQHTAPNGASVPTTTANSPTADISLAKIEEINLP